MNFEQVYQRFIEISGLDETEAVKWQWVCSIAIDELKVRLKNNIDYESNCDRLNNAAAALAFYKYCVLSVKDNITNFKAGDVTVELSADKTEKALEFWQASEKAVSDLLTDSSFFFKRVMS